METVKAKEFREKYGIYDSRNEYTEEQLVDLSRRKLYYVKFFEDVETGNIHIEYEQVLGYVSEDSTACIFIKSETITGRIDCYMPMKRTDYCMEIKKGIYRDGDVIYCTTDEIQFCLDCAKERALAGIQNQIAEKEAELLKLKNAKIVISPV